MTSRLVLAVVLFAAVPLSARDWFVDNSAAPGGDGSAPAPFTTLRAAQEASGPGDGILIRAGSSPYAEGVVLKQSQSITAEGGGAVIANPDGDGIVLAPDTAVVGLTIRAGGHAAVRGSAAGNVTLRAMSIEIAGGADGIALTGARGHVAIEGRIAGSGSGTAVVIDGGDAAITFDRFVLSQKGGAAVVIRNRTGGSVRFQNGSPITVIAGTKEAVVLTSNRGGIVFDDPLEVTTTGASALVVRQSESVTIRGASSVFSTAKATGVRLAESGVAIDVRSISVDGTGGGANEGIVIDDVRGSVRVGGGTIRGVADRGIAITRSAGVTLRNMTLEKTPTRNGPGCGLPSPAWEHLKCNAAIRLDDVESTVFDGLRISGSAQIGISGDNVRGLEMANTQITASGDELEEAGVRLRNVAGDVRFENCTIRGSAAQQLSILNDTGEATIRVRKSAFGESKPPLGQQGMLVTASSYARLGLSVEESTFTGNFSNALHVILTGKSRGDVAVSGSTFQENAAAILLTPSDSAALTYRIEGNTVTRSNATAFNVHSTSLKDIRGTIARNIIGEPGRTLSGASCGGACSGIVVTALGQGTSVVAITGNTLQQVDSGIRARAGDRARMNVRITGNTLREPSGIGGQGAINLQAGMRPNDAASLCAHVGGDAASANVVSGTWSAGAPGSAIRIMRRFPGASLAIGGYAGSRSSAAEVARFIAARNRGTSTSADLTGELAPAADCPLP